MLKVKPEVDAQRLSLEDSSLIVLDVQERLMNAMRKDVRDHVVAQIRILIQAADRLGVPILLSEQYPQGLGSTLPELTEALPEYTPFTKLSFSCCGVPGFLGRLKEMDRRRVLLCGTETHVCVYQTALDLLAEGYAVHVASDATCSRTKENWRTGIALMNRAGAVITSTETALFDLLREAGTDDFKFLSKLVR